MARRRAGLSQRQLAERLGCRQATIARWERGDRAPSFEDVQDAASACGLQIDAHLVAQDRSWWPQIALQLQVEPIERVRRLSPPGVEAVSILDAIAQTRAAVIVIGELAGALHGSPLVLGGTVELCGRSPEQLAGRLRARRRSADEYELSTGRRLMIRAAPAGICGYGDLARSAETVNVDGRTVQVASLLDLIRIADASSEPDARRQALACQAVLEVIRAQRAGKRAEQTGSDRERIEQWLSHQTPAA